MEDNHTSAPEIFHDAMLAQAVNLPEFDILTSEDQDKVTVAEWALSTRDRILIEFYEDKIWWSLDLDYILQCGEATDVQEAVKALAPMLR